MSELDITADEFIHWQSFLLMEPPDDAENRRAAAIMATITNMAGRSLKDGKKVSADDFYGTKEEWLQTAAEQIALLKGLGSDG